MGQEESRLVDPDTPPDTLSGRSLRAVADYINDGKAKRVVVMTGAGISTAAGIPDFRSPKTGLYNNLSRFNLPHPEAVFEIDFFRNHPEPFYLLAKELYPGNFSPTISHAFIALLAQKNLLRMLFTQNIDCLERAAGVPGDKIIEAHGSFATQRCIECRTSFPDGKMREYVTRGEPPHCIRSGCNGLVKPDIVFFGEQLPESFYQNIPVAGLADLVLVMGTSLQVHPFASLPQRAAEGVPRVLFNLERVGDLGTRADDVLVLGSCDSGVRKLADELGWRGELESMWRGMVGEKEADRQVSNPQMEGAIRDEVEELIEDVEDKLDISEGSDDEPDANVGKQEKGLAEDGAPGGSDSTARATQTDTANADASKLVDESVESRAQDTEKQEQGASAQEEGQEDKTEEVGDSRPPLSYEPVGPTAERPVTEEN
ncbi:NAD-dependent deacetylase sirtuin-2 [Hypoxylon trugodes]|uniref:NAD-dependent deacetylase sirtuin-2 n=1 Tax=Hypoxylon trugodes TaxID=326681 RepID=UPI00219300D5|nr:NAD-dependent deacetylase sirtuin-2 [Hypoxylon trugodes]KAI1392497.1 NAD-dependent deacetylase sirtuin-2 [Hypoxylon trugodes]